MKKFFLAALVVALACPVSEACVAGRRAAKTVTKTKTVARTGVLPGVRAVVVAPVKTVGAFLPCPHCK